MSPTGVLICCTVPSEAVPFVYLASVCWSLQGLVSVLTQAGGGGLLFRLLVPSRCGEGWRCFPRLRCSGSRLLYRERALRRARFQPSGAPQKPGTKSCACVLCLPRPSGSRSQELDGRTLPGAARLLPSASPSLPAQVGACALCLPATIQNLRRSVVRNWRPVCSAVGAAVLGPSLPLSPPPCLLPPAGLGRSAACELFFELARSLGFANGRQCVRAG